MNESVSFSYETREQDVLTALSVIDFQNRTNSRQTFQLLGVAVVLWMFIPETVNNPQNPINWLMLFLSAAVGVFVWKGASWQQKRFAHSLTQSQPSVSAKADSKQLILQSADGTTTFPFDQPMKVYEYQNVLAVNGGLLKISAIPKDQLAEEQVTQLRELLTRQLGEQFETVEQITHRRR